MRTRLHRSHAPAFIAVERPIHTKWPNSQRTCRDFFEYLLRVKRSVVITDAGVIASYDQVRATVVLAESGVEQGFARARVAHLQRVAALDYVFLAEVLRYQRVDCFHADIGRNVTGLELAQRLMHIDSVGDLDRGPRQISMRVVHRVTELQTRNSAPAAVGKQLARLGRALINPFELVREV